MALPVEMVPLGLPVPPETTVNLGQTDFRDHKEIVENPEAMVRLVVPVKEEDTVVPDQMENPESLVVQDTEVPAGPVQMDSMDHQAALGFPVVVVILVTPGETEIPVTPDVKVIPVEEEILVTMVKRETVDAMLNVKLVKPVAKDVSVFLVPVVSPGIPECRESQE